MAETNYQVAVGIENVRAFYEGAEEALDDIVVLFNTIDYDKMEWKSLPIGDVGLYTAKDSPYSLEEHDDLSGEEGYTLAVDVLDFRGKKPIAGGTWETLGAEKQALIFRAVGEAGVRTMVYQMSAFLANAFTASLGGDGEPLCSDAHPLKGGGVSSNYHTLALTADNVAACIAAMRLMKTDQGAPCQVRPRYLEVHPSKLKAAMEICLGNGPGSSTNDAYWQQAQLIPVMNDFTDDLTDWRLHSDNPISGLQYIVQKRLSPTLYFHELNGAYYPIGNFRAAPGLPSWRRIYGNSAA
jgi:hypothetical protein